MSYLHLLTVCVSLIVGFLGVATVLVAGWVKASHLEELKDYAEKQIECLRSDVNKLWEKVSTVAVLSSKLEAVEKGIDRIESMLINSIEKRNKKED